MYVYRKRHIPILPLTIIVGNDLVFILYCWYFLQSQWFWNLFFCVKAFCLCSENHVFVFFRFSRCPITNCIVCFGGHGLKDNHFNLPGSSMITYIRTCALVKGNSNICHQQMIIIDVSQCTKTTWTDTINICQITLWSYIFGNICSNQYMCAYKERPLVYKLSYMLDKISYKLANLGYKFFNSVWNYISDMHLQV